MLLSNHHLSLHTNLMRVLRPGFHYTTNATTTMQKQSDSKVEQSSFKLIALFGLEIGRRRGRNWLNGNQALIKKTGKAGNKNYESPRFYYSIHLFEVHRSE